MNIRCLLSASLILGLAACSASGDLPMRGSMTEGDVSSITGSLTYRERIALPPGSIATVYLQETSRADAPAIDIDTRRYAVSGVPFGFALELPNRDRPANARYTVRARITAADGDLLFTTDTVNPVANRIGDQQLGEIVMVRAS